MAQRQRRKAEPRKQASSLKPFYIALAVLALAGVGWIFYSLAGGGGGAAVEPIELTGLDDSQALLEAARGTALGEPNAPLTIRIFSDYTCPSCKFWVENVEPLLKREFIETGQVKLIHHDFPLGGQDLHRHSFIAARAARCAEDQGRYWEYHDVLFARQSEWFGESRPPISRFVEYARLLGLDVSRFEDCVRSDQHAEVVSANKLLGETLGVGGTPTVYIGARALNDWSRYPSVKAAVEAELNAKAGAADSGAGAS